MKIWAIVSGSCYDCSWNHVILPSGMDMQEQKKLWDVWYQKTYCPALRAAKGPKYVSFFEFLLEKGAKLPTANQLEELEL